MALTLTRNSAQGLARYASPYLASFLLMLAGGFLGLCDAGPGRRWDLSSVFGTQLLYEALVVAVLAHLYRKQRRTEESLLLFGVLLAFVFDALLIQHRYGWEEAIGIRVAVLGALSGAAFLLAAATALRLAPVSRGLLTAGVSLLFVRLGPCVLARTGDARLGPLPVWRELLFGVLLSACLAPSLHPRREARADDGLPARSLDAFLTGIALVFALVHFFPALHAFGPHNGLVALAPFLILLAPALERGGTASAGPALRRLCDLLPVAGLAVSAAAPAPCLVDAGWAERIPLTPFFLASAAFAGVSLWRAQRHHRPSLLYAGAAGASLTLLGGDLPQALARLVVPSAWQLLAVGALAWVTTVAVPLRAPALLLHALLPSTMLEAYLQGRGLPPGLGYGLGIGSALLGLDALGGSPFPRGVRLSAALLVSALPVAVFVLDVGSAPALLAALAGVAGLLVRGVRRRDRLLVAVSLGAAAVGVLGGGVRFQARAGASLATLLVEAAFALLLLGFLNSLAGATVERRLRWLRGGAADPV